MTTHSSTLGWKIPWTEEPGWPHRGDTKSWTWLSKTFASTVKQKATIEVFKPLLISKFCVDSNYTYYFHIYADVIIDEVFTNFILSMHSSGDNY